MDHIFFFSKQDVNKLYSCVPYEVVDKEQARREILTINEAAKLINHAPSTLHHLIKRGKFFSARCGRSVLITLSSLVSFYKPQFSTYSSEVLKPLVVKHSHEEYPDIYAYIEKWSFRLKFTDSSVELDNAIYSLYLGDKIEKNTSYNACRELLKSTVNNWVTDVFEDLYYRLYARKLV